MLIRWLKLIANSIFSPARPLTVAIISMSLYSMYLIVGVFLDKSKDDDDGDDNK